MGLAAIAANNGLWSNQRGVDIDLDKTRYDHICQTAYRLGFLEYGEALSQGQGRLFIENGQQSHPV